MEELLRVENIADNMQIQYDVAIPNAEIAGIDDRLPPQKKSVI